MLTDSQVNAIRSRFPIFQRKIYLNTCSQGPLSDAVESGFHDYISSWHELGSPWELWVQHYEAARTAFAQFINASPDEVAIVTSVSAGINSIASALNFRERPKVVMGEFEFPTMGHVWLGQCPRGADVQFVKADGNRIPLGHYENVIDLNTLIVALTHVCFKNGSRSDVAAVTQIAHNAGAFVMLDDYQDCGTRPIDVKAMDLDFYLAGTLKYLLGPPGLAFLYVREELIPTLSPTIHSISNSPPALVDSSQELPPSPTSTEPFQDSTFCKTSESATSPPTSSASHRPCCSQPTNSASSPTPPPTAQGP